MTEGFAGIIKQLERQKTAIDHALAALREIDGIATPATVTGTTAPKAPTGKRRKFSAAVRRKMALAQKARWSKIKGETKPPSPPAPEPAEPKRRISAEGMKRIIAATKKRWRLQRAAAKSAEAKKAAPKKAAVKKAVVKAPTAKAVRKVAKAKKAAPAPPAPAPEMAQTAG
jgi:hypothetical protein